MLATLIKVGDMSREIKFRAWNGSKMVDCGILPNLMTDGFRAAFDGYGSIYTRDYPVMQFTGWIDAEGEPIYEGDILECDEHFLYEISWSEKHACWYASDCGGLDDLPSNVKVIGNIYQHPELLK